MPLPPGTRLGVYEVTEQIGAGGMGEVYRATDSNLKRSVAIKVLPASVAGDADRLMRFQREAEVLAALNHPHIAAIYGLEKTPEFAALVMELVDGEDLSQRIARGAIPIDEALPIVRQIAEALEAAHEQGIVHRDLKPANVKVRPDGTVKVLDFGLAKVAVDEPKGSSPQAIANSPTITSPAMTEAGIILGTAAYMAPEQAKGKAVDRRADIWAFGAVLFEMLTGTRAFDGGDLSSTIAFVITKEPDWSALPANTPTAIRKLLRRCLEKDPKRRLQSIGDVRLEIDEALTAPIAELPPVVAVPTPRRFAAIVVASVLGSALIAVPATWMLTRPAPPAPPSVTRFTLVPAAAQPLSIHGEDRDVAVSPDGTLIVYRAGQGQLAVRRLDQLEVQLLTGVGEARDPFFSPDGRWIGFFDNGDIKKIAITGGAPISLGGVGFGSRGASWGDDDTIVFGMDTLVGILSVPAGGGAVKTLSTPDASQREIGHWFPVMLPGGKGVLFTAASADDKNSQVAVLDLKTGQRKTVIHGASAARYVDTGHLVYAAAGTLRAVRFDLARLEVTGDSIEVVDHLMVASTGEGNFDVSRQGTLVFVPGGIGQAVLRQVVWVDRKGHEEPLKAPLRGYVIPRLSPDGTRIALQTVDQERDIWTWDLARETLTRVTVDPDLDVQPVWSTDGRRILFASGRGGSFNLYWHAADGSGADTRMTTSPFQQFPNAVTPDGSHVIGYQVEDQKGNSDVAEFAPDGASQPLFRTAFHELSAEISPDGRYLAYQSDESGRDEVYVRPYPKVNDGRWQVSTGGGTRALWARNGRELFFTDASNTLTSVTVETTGAAFKAGNAVKVFDTKYSMPLPFRTYDVSLDGQRFLMLKDVPTEGKVAAPGITVVVNWLDELNAKLPPK